MKLNIINILYYGRHYSCEKQTYEVLWWFCLNDYCIYSTEDLINTYSYKTCEEIKNSKKYVSVFQIDIIELEKDFIEKFCYNLPKISFDNGSDYDVEFKRFIETHNLTPSWCIYEREKLKIAAINWCEKHNIPYTLSDN